MSLKADLALLANAAQGDYEWCCEDCDGPWGADLAAATGRLNASIDDHGMYIARRYEQATTAISRMRAELDSYQAELDRSAFTGGGE